MPLPKRKYNESHSKFMNRCVLQYAIKNQKKNEFKSGK